MWARSPRVAHGLPFAGALVACALANGPLPAESAEVLDLPDVTVTAPRPRFAPAPQHVVAVSRAQIEALGAKDLGQVLSQLPGIIVRHYGPVGQLSTLSMRGSLGEGVLVLRDGVKLNSAAAGGVDLSAISLAGIDHIEVVKGGASSLYGSEAVGGVVRLVSRRSADTRFELGMGTWGERDVTASTQGTLAGSQVTAEVQRSTADNDYPYAYRGEVITRDNAALVSTGLTLTARTDGGGDRLDSSLTLAQRDLGVPGPVNYPSPQARQSDMEGTGAISWRHAWANGPEESTSLSHRHGGLTYLDPQSAYQKRSDSTLDSTDLQSMLQWSGDETLTQWGLGVSRDALTSSDLGNRERIIVSSFGHATWWATPAFTLYGDARADHHDTFGWGLSPRLGATYLLGDRVRARAASGLAYRAPTFNELYWPQTSQSGGNPNLHPEVTQVNELGLDLLSLGPLELASTAYWNLGTGTLLWMPDALGKWIPSNLGRTETRGVELEATMHVVTSLDLTGGVTWTSSLDQSDSSATRGKTLVFRPDWLARADLTYRPIAPVALTLGWSHTGTRYTTAQNTDSLPAFDLWNASIRGSLGDRDSLTVRVENLLNTYYELQPYYPMPGRSLVASWAHTF